MKTTTNRKQTLGRSLLCAAFALTIAVANAPRAHAQETEPATSSRLSGVAITTSAVRVKDKDVPREITDALSTAIKSGGSRINRAGAKYWPGRAAITKIARATT
jgi:hypothetical protein